MSRSCGPSCATPSCSQPCTSPCSYPVGRLSSRSHVLSSDCGASTSARCLGLTSGASTACVNQIPPSELVIHPPPVHMIIPGPVLTASCEPLSVGGYTACGGSSASDSSSCRGLPSSGRLGISGSCNPPGYRRVTVSKVCSSPC